MLDLPMSSFQPLPAIFGGNPCVVLLGRKHGLKLVVNDLFILSVIKQYNVSGVHCGICHISAICKANYKCTSPNKLVADIKRLSAAGLVTTKRIKLLNITVTVQGCLLLDGFEKLLSNYKLKGLPS